MNNPDPINRPRRRMHRVTGQRFTFTHVEGKRLHSLACRIQSLIARRDAGWRVCVVQDVTDMHAVIQGALDRSGHSDDVTRQPTLPQG